MNLIDRIQRYKTAVIKKCRNSRSDPFIFILILMIAFFAGPHLSVAAEDMNNYCVIPHGTSTNIMPNVFIVLDNSESLNQNAYPGWTYHYCATERDYYGLFESGIFYKYCVQNSKTLFCAANNKDKKPTWMPLTAAQLLVEKLVATQAEPVIKGNLLNWWAMRRIDVAKKVLIGGRVEPDSAGKYYRTWDGAKHVKIAMNTYSSGYYFCRTLVRGGVPGDLQYINGAYGKGNCKEAVYYPDIKNSVNPEDVDLMARLNNGWVFSSCVVNTGSISTYSRKDIWPYAVDVWPDKLDNLGTGVLVKNGWERTSPNATAAVNEDIIKTVRGSAPFGNTDESFITLKDGTKDAASSIITRFRRPADSEYASLEIASAGLCPLVKKAGPKASDPKIIRRTRVVYRIKTNKLDGTCCEEKDYTTGCTNVPPESYLSACQSWAKNPVTKAAWDPKDFTHPEDDVAGRVVGAGMQVCDAPDADNYYQVARLNMYTISATKTSYGHLGRVDLGEGNSAEGLLQQFGSNDVRFGLGNYAVTTDGQSEGGQVAADMDFGASEKAVTAINNMKGSIQTPLAETLYEIGRYFKGDDPYYTTNKAAPDYLTGKDHDPFWYKYNDIGAGDNQYVPCAKSFVMMLTDGESTYDENIPGGGGGSCSVTNIKGCYAGTRFAGTPKGKKYPESGTDYLIDVAHWLRANDLRSDVDGTQNVTFYPVYMFGKGSTLLKDAAIVGGFDYASKDELPDCNVNPGRCYKSSTKEPLTYFEAEDGNELKAKITGAILDILRRISSGTAVSLLSSSEGSGSSLLQAIFYPRRNLGSGTIKDEITWTGLLSSLWYYIDPLMRNSSIREDTVQDKKLNLKDDYIAEFGVGGVTLYEDKYGDGIKGTTIKSVGFDELSNIWEAGLGLWKKSADSRTIKTHIGSGLIDFSTTKKSDLKDYLQAADDAESEKIIKYIRGTDQDGYRSRTIPIDLNKDNDTADADEGAKVWKLGDIITSTPKVSSWVPLNSRYSALYGDKTYDTFVKSSVYKDRGMVFVGANDGMLHAFKSGKLELPNDSHADDTCIFGKNDKACLSGSGLGNEEWAFIPKNVLPYLKYMADPSYCHIYSVDLAPFVFDASIGVPAGCIETDDYWKCAKTDKSWRTILIGGMRTGGACRKDAGGEGVKAPAKDKGYSSYFALDVTDQNSPALLWEFSDPDLGFATTGPAVVRIKDGADITNEKNGKWFVVFGSGPTGPIKGNKFLWHSDQNLKFFVLDLKTGALATDVPIDTGISNAFAGSMFNSVNDTDSDTLTGKYQDDVVYVPYVKKCSETNEICTKGKWNNGGVGRLFTKQNPDPNNWKWNIVIDDVGPVTAGTDRLEKKSAGRIMLYFGTGRYGGEFTDDADKQRALFGVKDPCPLSENGTFDTSCTATVSFSDLTDVTDINKVPTVKDDIDAMKGWYIKLAKIGESGVPNTFAERVITTPMASTQGVVFFQTFLPSSDVCDSRGYNSLWAVQYLTGGAPSGEKKGEVIMQVSTGRIAKFTLGAAGDFSKSGGRQSIFSTGAPSPGAESGATLSEPPPPVKRVLHIMERR